MPSTLASLRGVRFVHDDGVLAVGQLADVFLDERELLERGDDDGCPRGQRLGKLIYFSSRKVVSSATVSSGAAVLVTIRWSCANS